MDEELENEAARFFGRRYALAAATGSGSFSCALAGLGIGPGDEVIIPSFCWYTDFTCVAMSGALPVFADVDESLNLDPEAFERKISPRTKAVILIYYQGGSPARPRHHPAGSVPRSPPRFRPSNGGR